MSFNIHSFLLLAGVVGAATALAQTDTKPTQQHPIATAPQGQSKEMRVSLDDLMGADVMLAQSSMDKSDKQKKGKVKDLVISSRDGRISSAAVSVGGLLGIGDKVVLVPVSSLACTMADNKPCYEVKMTEAQLKALAEFDVGKAAKEGVDRAVENAKSGIPADAAHKDKDMGDMKGPSDLVLASQLKGAPLYGTDKEFGKIHNASVDTARNQVDYLLVSQGGTLGMGDTIYILPYQGLSWTRMEDKNVLKATKSIGELKTAPEYKKPEKGFLTADQMKQADTFAGIKRSEAFN